MKRMGIHILDAKRNQKELINSLNKLKLSMILSSLQPTLSKLNCSEEGTFKSGMT